MSGPLISVITPVLNARDTLEQAILSVSGQSYPHVEHIIIDGGSRDGSLELIKANAKRISCWISEKDQGIYDAMDKGIDLAKGDWLYFLGADDRLYSSDVLSCLFEGLKASEDAVMITGKVLLADSTLFSCRFNAFLFIKNTIHHQGVFYRRDVFRNYRYGLVQGRDKARYKISADYDLNLKLYCEGARCISTDRIIAECGKGISLAGDFSGYREEMIIRRRHLIVPFCTLLDILTMARFVFKRARRRASFV
jgi:glycosyltransferase involved in cell wall biosynthesis